MSIALVVGFIAMGSWLSGQDSASQANQSGSFSSANASKAGSSKKGVAISAKVLTVDAGELYNRYDKAIEAREKFNQAEENARKEINDMLQEGMKLHDAFKELQAKANNPSLTEEAKNKFVEEANTKLKLIEEKQMQIAQYKQQAEQTLLQRQQSITNLHLSDMKDACAKLAKEKGANLVLNSTGVLLMYSDGSADITEEAIEVLNASKK